MFFSLAQRKELKETSTPSKASPYMGRMQFQNWEDRNFENLIKVARTIKEPGWVVYIIRIV